MYAPPSTIAPPSLNQPFCIRPCASCPEFQPDLCQWSYSARRTARNSSVVDMPDTRPDTLDTVSDVHASSGHGVCTLTTQLMTIRHAHDQLHFHANRHTLVAPFDSPVEQFGTPNIETCMGTEISLGPFHVAIAVPSVTRCRCCCCCCCCRGHRTPPAL